jgi:hypothetical protein
VTGGVRRRSLLLVCLVALAGCGGGGSNVTVPAGFTVRTVDNPSFSIALPQSWRSFGDRSHASAKKIAGDNERLRVELETLAESNSPIKLVAFDLAGRRASTNMNVLLTQVPSSLTFEEMARTEARQIRSATGAKFLRQEETHLPAGRALHLTYRAGSGSVLQQYFIRHDDFLYVLTYSTRSADAARHAKIFDLSAHTFQIG